jgi:hypothetical protein
MTDLEGRVKALLEERSKNYPADPAMPPGVATRSRRRRALVGAGAGLCALAVIVLAGVALRALAPLDRTAGTPTPTPSPTPAVEAWRGIWPQASREEGEVAQAHADAGEPATAWQLNVVKVLGRYARQELGFAEVRFDETLDVAEGDSSGPETVHVISCEPRDVIEWPPVCGPGSTGMYSEITVERLLRADRTGIWFVTEALPATPVDAEPVGSPEPVAVYPDTFVGITNDGDLVLASIADGSVIRILLDREPFDLELRSSAFSPDGSSVYVTERAQTNTPRILSVPLDGGEPVFVARGFAPAVSADGRLAFSACGQDGCGTELEVELPGGTSARLDVSRFVEEGVGAIAWLPDGRLVVSIFYPGDSGPDLRVVDPVSPPDHLLDLPAIGRRRVGDGWFVLGHHAPTGGVAVHYYCCSSYGADPIEVQRVISIDPDTGEYGPPLVEVAPFGVTLDRTGRFFLLLQRSEDGTVKGLFLLEQDGHLRRIAEGYVEVAW